MTEREELIARIKGLYAIHNQKTQNAIKDKDLSPSYGIITPEIIEVTRLFPEMERLKIGVEEIFPGFYD